MTDNTINTVILGKDTRLFIGNMQIVLMAAAVVAIEGASSREATAELLAGNSPTIYAQVREQLAHEIEDERDGVRVVVAVSYGVGGTRNEHVLGTVEEVAAARAAEAEAARVAESAPAGEGESQSQDEGEGDNGGSIN